MFPVMAFALRHPASIIVLLAALGATATVFVVARPQYHPRTESKMIDFSNQRYYSPDAVRRVFAQHGVRLPHKVVFTITLFSQTARDQADDLQVLVAPRTGKGSWGPKLEPYDERFGNVAVTYGGRDEQLLERVKDAVSALRNA